MTRKGLSLIEVMIVLAVGVTILLPTIHLMISTQKAAYKGLDRLETLATARLILERVQRDLKGQCATDERGFWITQLRDKTLYSFPVFPTAGSGMLFTGNENPVNLVTYTFDAKARTLDRKLKVHPLLASTMTDRQETLGRNVASFSILSDVMLGLGYYDIDVRCVPTHPKRIETATHLRTGVRSEFVSRLERHPNLITNRRSKVQPPAE